ncbi:MAG: dienelactone hydrolase family protein [Rhizobiales bacterium]|nr:dienelactone hydrolase family protein [Hyphomicrobiales bacterium]MBN9009203.1 dienelactone hydrolase family protein [Hyphomicrobiales bacterium]
MIRLYDEYTHLTLDRRGFMAKLTKLAGSSAAAAAIVPLIAADPARAAIVAPGDPRVKAEKITFPGAKGSMKAYLALPAGASGRLPAVIVIHENRGLNAHIEDIARRLATEGFAALAVDFLSPLGGTPADEDKAREMFTKLDQAETVANAVAAVAFLRKDARTNGKVGAVGFCWGGGLVNQLAVHSPDLAAGVAYYGMQPAAADVVRIKAKLLLHYAGLDERIDAGIPAFEKALNAAGVDYQLYMYEGANHAFNNDTSAARYDKEAAELAWSRTIAFLKQDLA